jgi:hypothetical protein
MVKATNIRLFFRLKARLPFRADGFRWLLLDSVWFCWDSLPSAGLC